MTDRRDRERAEMRDRITAAARRLFVEEGYARTTIRAIADAIEYTPGAIYAYFKDKDAILYALHQQGFEELGRRMAQAAVGAADPIDELRRLGAAYLRFASDEPELYDLMFIAQSTSRAMQEDVWPEGGRTFGFLRSVVARAIDGGWVVGDDADAVSFLLWSACHGMASLHIRNRCVVFDEAVRDQVEDKAFDQLVACITKPRPSTARRRRPAPAARPRPRRSGPEL
ncbi:MAG: TetR/AcrR family transcriptional regulator [Kofleriaceae bacterium]